MVKYWWITECNLKTFLWFGTPGMSEECFGPIHEEITKMMNVKLFLFSTEGWIEKFQTALTLKCQQWILCIKLIFGGLRKGANILVTTRPTAEDFYSKLDFERNVEIFGFTRRKIEEYVKQFCKNNKTSKLAPRIWNDVQSSSELSNLCYIPVNCCTVWLNFTNLPLIIMNEQCWLNFTKLPLIVTELKMEIL